MRALQLEASLLRVPVSLPVQAQAMPLGVLLVRAPVSLALPVQALALGVLLARRGGCRFYRCGRRCCCGCRLTARPGQALQRGSCCCGDSFHRWGWCLFYRSYRGGRSRRSCSGCLLHLLQKRRRSGALPL